MEINPDLCFARAAGPTDYLNESFLQLTGLEMLVRWQMFDKFIAHTILLFIGYYELSFFFFIIN